jgi:rhodanese-related sulfurtransferase
MKPFFKGLRYWEPLVWSSILFAIAPSAAPAAQGAPSYQNIDQAALQSAIARGVHLVDIRTPQEWKQTGVIAGSIRLTAFLDNGQMNPQFIETFRQHIPSPDQPVALICRSGRRTQALAQILSAQLGYKGVLNVTGGIIGWSAQGLPLVKD